jgi:hypothetical protein
MSLPRIVRLQCPCSTYYRTASRCYTVLPYSTMNENQSKHSKYGDVKRQRPKNINSNLKKVNFECERVWITTQNHLKVKSIDPVLYSIKRSTETNYINLFYFFNGLLRPVFKRKSKKFYRQFVWTLYITTNMWLLCSIIVCL